MMAPAAALQVALFFVPLAIILGYSLQTRGPYGGVVPPWTIENFVRIADPLYGVILVRSFWLAGVATGLCLLIGFPLALFISRSGRRKHFYLQMVILPFWTSFLIRTYAWIFLLRDTGLINSALTSLGWIATPIPLLYNDGAVILGLVYGYLPFMVLPLFSTLERLDKSLLEASADLGARPWATFRKIILPLCAPGIRAGAILVFIPCLGAYLTPDLMGGGKTIMIGNLVQNQFTSARDWPFGSALSLVLMAIVMILLMAGVRGRSEDLV
jgi:spermidine/putrescine transport system permease protein